MKTETRFSFGPVVVGHRKTFPLRLVVVYQNYSGKERVPVPLLSLWEIMNKFGAADYGRLAASMMQMEQVASTSPPKMALPESYGVQAHMHLIEAAIISQTAGLAESYDLAQRTRHEFGLPIQCAELQYKFQGLRDLMESEMRKQLFFTISIQESKLYEQEKLFGEEVHKSFPSAHFDIKSAGTALACGLGTASVFHLMRAAEYGLRALAHDRRVRLPKKEVLALATWEKIISKLEDSEKSIQGYPKTIAREAQFEFYHGAMMEFKRFKNKFRNRVSHTREDYDAGEANKALGHVREFMKILASRISENTRTPIVWKGKKWTNIGA